jgi:hypothetical protein
MNTSTTSNLPRLIFCCFLVFSLDIRTIPPQGSPPMEIQQTSSVFDSQTSTIYIIGGRNFETDQDTSDIYSFNLATNQWSFVYPESSFIPDGMSDHFSYLAPNRVIYTFGVAGEKYFSDVFTFDLKTSKWGTAEIQGDDIAGRKLPTMTSFEWNGEPYIALYGGFCATEYDANLYL